MNMNLPKKINLEILVRKKWLIIYDFFNSQTRVDLDQVTASEPNTQFEINSQPVDSPSVNCATTHFRPLDSTVSPDLGQSLFPHKEILQKILFTVKSVSPQMPSLLLNVYDDCLGILRAGMDGIRKNPPKHRIISKTIDMNIVFRNLWNIDENFRILIFFERLWKKGKIVSAIQETYRKRINEISNGWLGQDVQNGQKWCDKSHDIRRNSKLFTKHIGLWQYWTHRWTNRKEGWKNVRQSE